jgi:hypothetical protein
MQKIRLNLENEASASDAQKTTVTVEADDDFDDVVKDDRSFE